MSDAVDYNDLQRATTELSRLTVKLAGMSGLVADARTVKEFQGERQKASLSRAVLRAFKNGCDSTSKAEHQARGDETYAAEMKTLREHYANAENALTEFQIIQIQIDSLRTLVAAQRAIYER